VTLHAGKRLGRRSTSADLKSEAATAELSCGTESQAHRQLSERGQNFFRAGNSAQHLSMDATVKA
jgi:hypothetical protein